MLFSAPVFWLFFVICLAGLFVCRVVLKNVTMENAILLIASYVFYSFWDVRFLALIVFVSLQTYFFGHIVLASPSDRTRRRALLASVVINLGILFVFKYFGFFVDNLRVVFGDKETIDRLSALDIVLPVGISFYIFQTLTFVVDAYRGGIKTTPPLLNYLTYIAFFPQLVAGPIERAVHLLPQFETHKEFRWEDWSRGTALVVVGLFLKMVIADPLGDSVDEIFMAPQLHTTPELALGAVFFAAQIYGDFCGYSTIAIGVAMMMGFSLMANFRTPYFSTSVSEFWRRWHISLSSFFRDYVYIPLGGNRHGFVLMVVSIFVTFVLSGLWHGAAWGFIIWGAIHGMVVVLERIWFRVSAYSGLNTPRTALFKLVRSGIGLGYTLVVVCAAWVFFRLPHLHDALAYFSHFSLSFPIPYRQFGAALLVLWLFAIDLFWKDDPLLEKYGGPRPYLRESMMAIMAFIILGKFMTAGASHAFIYFQF